MKVKQMLSIIYLRINEVIFKFCGTYLNINDIEI